MKTVGVIGAGAAGLCALRHLRDVGGTWVYQQGAGLDSRGLPIHSSMYKSLRTNLPKEVMAFPDFPFKAGGESFLHHTEVLQYLKDYTKHYGLEADIKFEHLVEHVVPSVPGDPGTGWHVTVRDLRDGGTSSTLCDALMVCNGHYSVPAQPDVPGMERFAGITQHSHSYREPSRYAGKTVIVLGASASGVDISLELSGVAETVYLSHNHALPLPSTLPPNLTQRAGVVRLKDGTEDVFVLKDGTEIQADAIVFCTGYQYTYPFLDPSCGLEVRDNQVTPLYRHLVHARHPTMCLPGIPFKVAPFPCMDVQVRYFVSTISGGATLPPPATLLASLEEDRKGVEALGRPPRHLHMLEDQQWAYFDDLAAKGGVSPLPGVYERLYKCVAEDRRLRVMWYKGKRYALVEGGEGFVVEKKGSECNGKVA